MNDCNSPFECKPTYSWVCHSCKTVNNPGEGACQACGFPAVATGEEIQAAVTGIKRPAQLSRKELLRQRRREIAALSLWKKPFAYLFRLVQFVGGLVLWFGVFNLAVRQIMLGIALAVVAEVLYQLLKGKSNGQQTVLP